MSGIKDWWTILVREAASLLWPSWLFVKSDIFVGARLGSLRSATQQPKIPPGLCILENAGIALLPSLVNYHLDGAALTDMGAILFRLRSRTLRSFGGLSQQEFGLTPLAIESSGL